MAARGDRESLRALYEEYSGQLFGVAYRLTESPADASDVLHDVFCRLPKAIRSFDPKRSLGPWLRAVTARAALKRLELGRRRGEIPITWVADELDAVKSPEASVLSAVVLEQVLSSLPDELRIVVVLKEVEGYSHREIAELLQIAPSTSERRLHRARRMLRAGVFGQ